MLRHATMVLVMGFLLVGFGLVAAGGDTKEKADLQKLEGSWKLFHAEHNGKEFTATGKILFGRKGDYVMIWDGEREEGVDRLNPSKTPKEIDVVIKEGDRKGTTLTGIYKIEGDVFTACYGKEFKVAGG